MFVKILDIFRHSKHPIPVTQSCAINSSFKNLINSMAPEPKGSSLYSQEPATGPYPEPTGSNLHSPSQSP
jgi:hypothetical protein